MTLYFKKKKKSQVHFLQFSREMSRTFSSSSCGTSHGSSGDFDCRVFSLFLQQNPAAFIVFCFFFCLKSVLLRNTLLSLMTLERFSVTFHFVL